jgi:cobalt-zinc-cadmium efflux system protein
MGAGHAHGGEVRYERPLWWALGLTATFLVAEVVGGLMTNSLALLSDAAHMGTDVIALAIALVAVHLARRPPDSKRTYGYARMEAIGAMVNGGLLFLVAGYILLEAVGRFMQPPAVASTGMFVVATLGLVVNLISMRLLKAGSGESLNIKGAYLEVWADMLGSLGVIAGALVIEFTGYRIADPIIAALIGLWVLPRTWALVSEAGRILMQSVPAGLDLAQVRALMMSHPHVEAVHDLHAWTLGSREPVMTAHIVLKADKDADADTVRQSLAAALAEKFDIAHATLQVERRTACSTGQGHS